MRAGVSAIDETDFAVYRYLAPDGAARFWGSRRVIDPRAGAREIAERLGISETGVRTRLRSLRERGYLADAEVWPNPSLFGVELQVAELPVDEVGESRRLLDDLGLVDGVTFARDVLDERDRTLQVYFVAGGPAEVERRARLLRRLVGRNEVRGPRPYFVPPAARPLTPLDWRIVRALRAAPEDGLQRIARSVGISLKTLGRRFHALLEGRAVWWSHGARAVEFPLALLTVGTDPAADVDALATRVSSETRTWMPVASDGRGLPPTARPPEFAGLLLADSPVAVEAAAGRLLDRAGVATVRRTFALGSAIYRAWFDEQIARRTS